jgi:hypothetical protein
LSRVQPHQPHAPSHKPPRRFPNESMALPRKPASSPGLKILLCNLPIHSPKGAHWIYAVLVHRAPKCPISHGCALSVLERNSPKFALLPQPSQNKRITSIKSVFDPPKQRAYEPLPGISQVTCNDFCLGRKRFSAASAAQTKMAHRQQTMSTGHSSLARKTKP